MTLGLAITGAGIATRAGAAGPAAAAEVFGRAAPRPAGFGAEGSSAARPARPVTAEVGIRYLDPTAECGVRALRNAVEEAGLPAGRIDEADGRAGLVVATRVGPLATRVALRRSFDAREGRSISGTLFSACGFNIAGFAMARAQGIRGPVLTVVPGSPFDASVLGLAGRMLRAGRARRLFVGTVSGACAMVLCVEPAGGAGAATPRAILLAGEEPPPARGDGHVLVASAARGAGRAGGGAAGATSPVVELVERHDAGDPAAAGDGPVACLVSELTWLWYARAAAGNAAGPLAVRLGRDGLLVPRGALAL